MVGRSAQVARGLNTIAGNVVKNQDVLKKYGIIVEDANGNLKSTFDVLTELEPKWNAMTEAERVALGDTLAGTNQYKVLASVLSNFQTALDATATAYNSAGSAAEENQKVVDSLQGKLASVRASFEQLANTVIDSGLISGVLDLANAFLQLLDTPVGAFITQVTLMTGVLGGLSGILKYFVPILTQFKNGLALVQLVATEGIAAMGGLSGAIGLAGGASAIAFPLIAGGVAIVWGLVTAVQAIKKAYDEANPSIEESTQKISDNEQKIADNKKKLEELNNTPWFDRTADIDREIAKIEAENENLQEQIDKYKALSVEKAKETMGATYEVYGSEKGYKSGALGITWRSLEEAQKAIYNIYGTEGMMGKYADFLIDHLQEVGTTTEQTGKILESNLIKIVEDYNLALSENNEESKDVINTYNNNKETIDKLVESYNAIVASGGTLTDSQKALLNAVNATSGAYNDAKVAEDLMSAGLIQNGTEVDSLVKKYPVLLNGVSNLNSEILNLIATNEIFNNQGLDVSGKLTALYKLATAAGIAGSNMMLLQAAMSGDTRAGRALVAQYGTSNVNGKVVGNFDTALKNYWNQMLGSGEKVGTGTATPAASSSSSSTKSKTDSALETFQSYYKDLQHLREMDEISESEYYERLQIAVEQYTADATKNMKAYGTDSKTIAQNMYQYIEELAKHTAEVEKARLETLKKTAQSTIDSLTGKKTDYEAAFGYVISQIDKEIQALEDQKTAITDTYQTQIDALNATNDAIEDQIALEKALDNLQKARSSKVMVYKDGRYQYVSDIDAVSEAQSNLESIRREQQLKSDTQALEEDRDKQLRAIDDMIYGKGGTKTNPTGGLYSYKLAWQNVVDSYGEQEGKLAAERLFGINTEQSDWTKRLANLSSFVSQYEALLEKLANAQKHLKQLQTPTGINPATGEPWHEGVNEGVNVSGADRDKDAVSNLGYDPNTDYSYVLKHDTTLSNAERAKLEAERQNKIDAMYGGVDPYKGSSSNSSSGSSGSSTVSKPNSSGQYATADDDPGNVGSSAWYAEQGLTKPKYANGTTSALGGLSLVGERGEELRVLGKGDGIIPADITKNLWSWGMTTPSSMLSALSGVGSSVSNAMQISIGNISLPSVSNASQFVEELKGFKRYAIQYGTGI